MEWLVIEDAAQAKTFIYFEHLPAIAATRRGTREPPGNPAAHELVEPDPGL